VALRFCIPLENQARIVIGLSSSAVAKRDQTYPTLFQSKTQ
jgi:hypothetical protein